MPIDIGELRGIISLQDNFSAPANSVSKQLGLMSESFGAVTKAAGLIAGAVGAAGGAIVALGVHGSAVADVKDAFGELARGAGAAADVMLGRLRDGTLGTISNFDLMKLANRALGTGLIKSSEDMGTLAAGAKLLADRTGGDTKEAFETLTSAMASGRTAQLKQLGLFVDSKVAVEAYASKLGKSVSDLNDHERATALSQGALSALKRELEASGGKAADFGDNIDRGKVAVQNLVDDLSVAIATSPVLAAGMNAMGEALQRAFGGSSQDVVKTLMGFVNQFGIGLVQAGQVAVSFGTFVLQAFQGAKAVFNAVFETLFSGIGKFSSMLADLAEKATTIPGIGSSFQGLATNFRGAADVANSLAIGFGVLTDDAVRSSDAIGAGGAVINEALAGVEAQMRKAMETGAELTTASEGVATGLRNVGESAGLSSEQIKAMEEATRRGQEAMFDSGEAIATTFEDLQQRLTLANQSGLELRLSEIEIARQREMEGLQRWAFEVPAVYERVTAMVEELYGRQAAAAEASFAEQALAAEVSYLSQIDQARVAYVQAVANYAALVQSGTASYAALAAAKAAATHAEIELDKMAQAARLNSLMVVSDSASSILRSLFGKSKSAAIAAAIIDTIAAVVKTLAAYPFPFSLIPAAAAAAAGYAQIAKIRSTDAGFQEGTPGTAFVDFGRGSTEILHGKEAVVTEAQGQSVAGMVADAIRDASGQGGGGGTTLHFAPVVNIGLDASLASQTEQQLLDKAAARVVKDINDRAASMMNGLDQWKRGQGLERATSGR